MDSWSASFCLLLLAGLLVWLYTWGHIINYDPHRSIVPEPWDIGAPSAPESYGLMTGGEEE